jgi:phenylacetate-CoA ligase
MNLNNIEKYHAGKSLDFTEIRNSLLTQMVNYAYNNCYYYKQLFKAAHIDMSDIVNQFNKIPLLDKSIIRDNSDLIISSNLKKMFFSKRNTGGSTGEPLEFYTSINYDSEHQHFLYRLMGYENGDKILAMDGTSIELDLREKNIYWAKKSDKDLPYGSMALSSLYLNNNTILSYIHFINTFKPSIIRGYPAFIDEIATYILTNKINFKLKMKGIVLTSESASRLQIDNIAHAFNSKVFLQYGHSEAALFGYSIDESYEYHCSPFYGFVEVVTESGENAKHGELGEVVVTGFYNYAMPFIRYKTGDLAVFSNDCAGIVKLKSVIGRTQDFVFNDKYEKTLLTALIFGLHYKAFANIKKWQIVQNKPGEVTIKIVREKSFDKKDEEEISNNFFNVAKILTKFEYCDTIPLTKRGKFMFLLQNIKQQIF